MPPDQLADPYRIFLTDPVLLAGSLLPIVMLAGLLIYRIRVSRRVTQLTKQNAEALNRNETRWQESAARTDKMIGLLTEIRDHLAKNTPASPSETL